MKIKLARFAENKESTLGRLTVDDVFFCFTLEDGHNEPKIPGRTRIPAGEYRLGQGPDGSDLTEKYRKRFPAFFRRHIEIKDIPNYNNVYMHVGNSVDDTQGCPLLGDVYVLGKNGGPHSIGKSVAAFTRYYNLVYPEMVMGKEVFLTVTA